MDKFCPAQQSGHFSVEFEVEKKSCLQTEAVTNDTQAIPP